MSNYLIEQNITRQPGDGTNGIGFQGMDGADWLILAPGYTVETNYLSGYGIHAIGAGNLFDIKGSVRSAVNSAIYIDGQEAAGPETTINVHENGRIVSNYADGSTSAPTIEHISANKLTINNSGKILASQQNMMVLRTSGDLVLANSGQIEGEMVVGGNAIITNHGIINQNRAHEFSYTLNMRNGYIHLVNDGQIYGWVSASGLETNVGSTFQNTGFIERISGGRNDDLYDGRNGRAKVVSLDEGNDTIYGGAYAEVFWGGLGNDSIIAGGGDDTIISGSGNDTVDGGEGFDIWKFVNNGTPAIVMVDLRLSQITVDGYGTTTFSGIEGLSSERASAVKFIGNDAVNLLSGGNGNDTLMGGLGNDTLTGGVGNDSIDAGGGDDSVSGGAGRDTVRFGDASMVVNLTLGHARGEGTDSLAEVENVITGSGNDSVTGDSGDNEISTGAGNDTIAGGTGNDQLNAGEGIDWAVFGDQDVSVDLSQGTATGQGSDTLAGFENVRSGAGNDTLVGGDGNNILDGGAGNDNLMGGAGNDTLMSGGGTDVLNGGDGNDTYYTDGTSTIIDSGGYDTVVIMPGGTVNLDELDGIEAVVVDNQTYTPEELEEILNGGGSNPGGGGGGTNPGGGGGTNPGGGGTIPGGGGTSPLPILIVGNPTGGAVMGNAADNTLIGSKAKDTLDGGAGNDVIYGKQANDYLVGGSGKDTFVFDVKADRKKNLDKISDFIAADDSIWIDNKLVTKIGKGTLSKPGALKKSFFTIGKEAKDKNDHVIYDKAKGVLYYDPDGSGEKAAIAFATVKPKTKLSAADFFVI